MSHHVTRDLYGSKAASVITSETYHVASADEITLFLRGSPSTTTVQGTNAEGLETDLTNTTADWSTLTVVVAPGPDLLNIEPGFTYIRCLRSETTEVRLGAHMRTR